MPLHVEKRDSKFRVVEHTGQIAKNAAGTALDGGGFKSKADAVDQMQAINLSKLRAHGHKGVPPAPRRKY